MYGDYLDLAVRAARAAGEIQRSYFRGGDLMIRTKSNPSDVVTRADRESEEAIARMIAEAYPDHALLGEEGGVRGAAASEWRWVVDPLDGTTNYSQGLPVFAVSIALQHCGETVVGAVYAPWLDELYTAVKDGGAWMSRGSDAPRRLQVGGKEELATAVLGTGFPYDKDVDPDNNSDNLARILPRVRDIRRMGAAAYDLCCIASGTLDGYWELALHEWDVCAGELLVREAGGIVHPLRAERGVSIAAGNPVLVREMLKHIR